MELTKEQARQLEQLDEKEREVDLLNRTVKRLHRMGAYSQDRQLLELAKEIERYRDKIHDLEDYIKGLPQAKPRKIVAVKVKKKANPALLVKAPPLPVGYEPDPGRRKRRQL